MHTNNNNVGPENKQNKKLSIIYEKRKKFIKSTILNILISIYTLALNILMFCILMDFFLFVLLYISVCVMCIFSMLYIYIYIYSMMVNKLHNTYVTHMYAQ